MNQHSLRVFDLTNRQSEYGQHARQECMPKSKLSTRQKQSATKNTTGLTIETFMVAVAPLGSLKQPITISHRHR